MNINEQLQKARSFMFCNELFSRAENKALQEIKKSITENKEKFLMQTKSLENGKKKD